MADSVRTTDVYSVVWWKRGMVVCHRDFTDREEALRAIEAC